jgi:hypothetical protein
MKLVHTLSVLVTALGLALPGVASADPLHGRAADAGRGQHSAVQHERRAPGHERADRERREWRDRRDGGDRGRWHRDRHERDCRGGHGGHERR